MRRIGILITLIISVCLLGPVKENCDHLSGNPKQH